MKGEEGGLSDCLHNLMKYIESILCGGTGKDYWIPKLFIDVLDDALIVTVDCYLKLKQLP